MTKRNLTVEVFPDIDIRIDLDKKKDRALITIYNKRLRTSKQMRPFSVAQAYTIFHKLHGIRKKMAEQRRNEQRY